METKKQKEDKNVQTDQLNSHELN